jgi:single-strand selective monofunctional uracil DNA glycosylase
VNSPPRKAGAGQTRPICDTLIDSAKSLSGDLSRLKFGPPVSFVYNPLEYAWAAHEAYLRTYATCRKRVVFFGMNPGPFGMVQTGVPFGEIAAVRDWLKIQAEIGKPAIECPKRPIQGFDCKRSEVSGFRLWGLFARRYPKAADFFAEHFVANYCPLAFMEEGGRNLTPDKLPLPVRNKLLAACNEHLEAVIAALQPQWLIGIGGFAAERAREVLSENTPVKIGQIAHPSPANPAANRNWAETAEGQLKELGVW